MAYVKLKVQSDTSLNWWGIQTFRQNSPNVCVVVLDDSIWMVRSIRKVTSRFLNSVAVCGQFVGSL